MKPSLFPIFLLIFLLTPSFTSAQWQQTPGPEGGDIEAIAATHSAIVASAPSDGIYRSTDNGATWALLETAPQYAYPLLAMGDSVFAGSDRLWLSTDAGLSWSSASTGLLGNESFLSIIASGSDLFASSITMSSEAPARIYRSTDRGMHWDSVSGIAQAFNFSLLGSTVLTDVSGTLLATSDSTVYRSTNQGSSWIWSGNGLPRTSLIGIGMFAVAGQTVAASASRGLFLSTDGGQHWQLQHTGTPLDSGATSCFWEAMDLIAGSLHGGIYRQSGGSWTKVDSTPFVQTFAVGNGATIGGSTSAGIIRSTNNGANWSESNNGVYGTGISAMAAIGNGILAASSNGLFRSSNEGQSWQRVLISQNGPSAGVLGSISVLASDGTTVFAANGDQIYRSIDAGQSWAPVTSPQHNGNIIAIALSGPLALTSSQITIFNGGFPSYSDSLYRSTDGGQTWQLAMNGIPAGQSFSPIAIYGDTMFAVTTYDSLVFRSTDRGASWFADTLPMGGVLGFINSMTRAGGRIFLAGSALFSSTDRGNHWELVSTNGLPANAWPIFGSGSSLLAIADSVVWLSNDLGKNWTRFGSGFGNRVQVASLTISNNYMLAGTNANSVWRRPLSDLAVLHSFIPNTSLAIQNTPNPFSSTTTIEYSIPRSEFVSIALYDALGRRVRMVYNGFDAPGIHSELFDARDLPDGAYFCQIIAGNETTIQSIIKLSGQ